MHQDSKDIKFLIRENKCLKDQIQDLREVIRTHKTSIDILSGTQLQLSSRSKVNVSVDAHSVRSTKTRQESRLLGVVKILNNQNSDLIRELESVKQMNDELNTKILLLEQITEASEKQEQETKLEYGSQMESLNKTLIQTQDRLLENERGGQGAFDSLAGLMVKYKEVHSLSEQACRFMQTEEDLSREIHILKATIEELKRSRDKLISVNVSLKNEVIKLKATMLMPNRTFDQAGQASLKRLALYFLDAQRKVCEDSDYEDDLELVAPELMVLFPDKVKKVHTNNEKPRVPKLNLMRVHQMMLKNQKKIDAQLKKRNQNMTKTERLSRLEDELEFTRRELTRTMLQLKDIESEKKSNDRIIEQLQVRNKILLDSYDGMRRKMNTMKPSMKRPTDLNRTYNVSMMNGTFMDKNVQFTRQSGRGNQIRIEQQNRNTQNDELMLTEKEEFEIQANNLAHQVAKLPFMDMKSGRRLKTKPDKKPQLIRSYSNPLLYMQDRKDAIFNRKPKDEEKFARVPEPARHDQTCFDRIDTRTRGYEQNLDDINI